MLNLLSLFTKYVGGVLAHYGLVGAVSERGRARAFAHVVEEHYEA